MRWCWLAIKVVVAVVLYTVEALFWLLHGLSRFRHLAGDAVKARRTLTSGVLHCPKGHTIETDTGTYQCTRCGFTSHEVGSVWLCQNPECHAVTSFLDCPTCGLSVQSPYRWGGEA